MSSRSIKKSDFKSDRLPDPDYKFGLTEAFVHICLFCPTQLPSLKPTTVLNICRHLLRGAHSSLHLSRTEGREERFSPSPYLPRFFTGDRAGLEDELVRIKISPTGTNDSPLLAFPDFYRERRVGGEVRKVPAVRSVKTS